MVKVIIILMTIYFGIYLNKVNIIITLLLNGFKIKSGIFPM